GRPRWGGVPRRPRGRELQRLPELHGRPGLDHPDRVRLLSPPGRGGGGRMMRIMRGAALALALSGAGCSFFAAPGDYAAYRATRVAPTLEERLAAAQRYLRDRPQGAFQDEVRAAFDHAEGVYYGSKRGSITGLYAYLEALPSGPHHEEAA